MKSYLKQHPPFISIVFIALLLGFALLVAFVPTISPYLILQKSDLATPTHWYKLLSYSLYIKGLQNWLVQSIILLLLGAVIEKQIRQPLHVIGLMLLSSIVGGVSFMLLSTQAVPLASPGMIIWGYSSAAIVLGLSHWYQSESAERVALIACVLLLLLQVIDFNLTVFLSQMVVMLVTGALVWLGYGKKSGKSDK
ncbi:hypothetical protein [Microscilla marina]|uniref:Membrane protein, putative n=1 Tax=Microscilla marina ATCC 23134 TaxID=313606 RepID=A1ZYH6_MICM2|nr:hypothetical protein [Microscilla marina]EAY24560.1 membrane protein, putative [Microscilla marina ATCC 23134]